VNLVTTGDLITFCLRLSNVNGVGQTPNAQDSNDGLTLLQTLLAQWQRRRWLVWDLTDTSFISTGAISYSVGAGGDVPITRPDKINSAFARLLLSSTATGQFINNGGLITILPNTSNLPTSPVGLPPGSYWNDGGVLAITAGGGGGGQVTGPVFIDYPLHIITAREEYNLIALKQLVTFPSVLFYDSAFPLGNLFFWPIPQTAQWELHIATKATLPVYTTLTDPLNLPPEYIEALIWTLAVRFNVLFGNPPQPAHVAAMQQALSVLRMANVQIPEARIPSFSRMGGGIAAGSSPGFNSGWSM
jgi:hypothetical protein